MPKVVVGLDIGGTKTLAGIITPDGRVLARMKKPTQPKRSTGEVIDGICATVAELMRTAGVQPEDILGMAAGAPGPLDYQTGIIRDPPNFNWRDLPLRDELNKRLGRQLLLENDANLAAMGEWRFGRSPMGHCLIYATVSTGIGGGIVFDGKLYRGRDGGAGEFGRMKFEAEIGPDSGRISRSLENLASGTAMAGQAQALLRQGRGREILALCGPDASITAREIGEAARQGSTEAMEIIVRAGRYLGLGLTNLVNIFNPDRLVIGGGAGLGLQDLWSGQLQACMNEWVSPALGHDFKIEFTALGEDVGLLGCAAVVMQELEKKRKKPYNPTFA